MTQIKPDKIVYTNLIDTYINYDTLASNVVISGSVGSGASVNFIATFTYDRANTRADFYAKNTSTGIKRPVSGGPRQTPYTFVSSETFSQGAIYSSGGVVVTFTVTNNTGATINLINQTFEVTAVLTEVPS